MLWKDMEYNVEHGKVLAVTSMLMTHCLQGAIYAINAGKPELGISIIETVIEHLKEPEDEVPG